jgi:hypothetical protein
LSQALALFALVIFLIGSYAFAQASASWVARIADVPTVPSLLVEMGDLTNFFAQVGLRLWSSFLGFPHRWDYSMPYSACLIWALLLVLRQSVLEPLIFLPLPPSVGITGVHRWFLQQQMWCGNVGSLSDLNVSSNSATLQPCGRAKNSSHPTF